MFSEEHFYGGIVFVKAYKDALGVLESIPSINLREIEQSKAFNNKSFQVADILAETYKAANVYSIE